MEYTVQIPNAFTVNKLGMVVHRFPLGISCSESNDGVFTMRLYPQNVVGICDLLQSHGEIVVFGVDHGVSEPEDVGSTLDLTELATMDGIQHGVIDANTITISSDELFRFLSGFSHWSLRAFDIAEGTNNETIIINVVSYFEMQEMDCKTKLSNLTAGSFLLESHDDCYVTLETYNVELLMRVFERTLQTYVGTLLLEGDTNESIQIGSVSNEVMEKLWSTKAVFTILPEHTTLGPLGVNIGVSMKAFEFKTIDGYHPDAIVEYDVANQKWRYCEIV